MFDKLKKFGKKEPSSLGSRFSKWQKENKHFEGSLKSAKKELSDAKRELTVGKKETFGEKFRTWKRDFSEKLEVRSEVRRKARENAKLEREEKAAERRRLKEREHERKLAEKKAKLEAREKEREEKRIEKELAARTREREKKRLAERKAEAKLQAKKNSSKRNSESSSSKVKKSAKDLFNEKFKLRLHSEASDQGRSGNKIKSGKEKAAKGDGIDIDDLRKQIGLKVSPLDRFKNSVKHLKFKFERAKLSKGKSAKGKPSLPEDENGTSASSNAAEVKNDANRSEAGNVEVKRSVLKSEKFGAHGKAGKNAKGSKGNKKKTTAPKRSSKQFFDHYLLKSGIRITFNDFKTKLLQYSIGVSVVAWVALLVYSGIQGSFSWYYLIFMILFGFIGTFCFVYAIGVLLSVFVMDIRIHQRKEAIELVLPDFLQLASSNIRSGMTIDKALWGAIRPQFGVLAYEMQLVAKQTMSGEELYIALIDFSKKYDSKLLQRSMSLLVEGLKAGGEIGDLLDRISLDMKQTQSMRKEMAADVTSYTMFITFATLGAAPFMYGLSYQLISITQSIMAGANMGDAGSQIGLAIGGGGGMSLPDFQVFALLNLAITSFFSVAIISTIKGTGIKDSLRNIPIFIAITACMFFVAIWGMGKMFAGLF